MALRGTDPESYIAKHTSVYGGQHSTRGAYTATVTRRCFLVVAKWSHLTQSVFRGRFAEVDSPTNPSTCPLLLLM